MSKLRVALIEDHDLTRVGLRLVFQQHPTVEIVGEASDGFTGLKLLETSQPDVAVVDLDLPGLDGIEVTRRFKQSLNAAAIATNSQPKIMILTMQGTEDSVLAAFAAGADSYCMKDLPAERLLEALQSTHEGNNWIDPAIAQLVLQHHRQLQAATAVGTSATKTVDILADGEQAPVLQAYPLTQRELEILTLVVTGYTNAKIASECYITIGTVKTHIRNILNKLCVDDRTQAAVRALRSGLVV
ncbi:response regulator transcription factor [Phormidium sp. FACHB-592]|uniref:Response regulator transcription factor n=1 Tax=Stenomitos frigidus AS-A4 TaxID=2933935 RepID=A0ABV0KH48_9CYAN|nr:MULTISPECIES: response regulator transcription factor [Cyanophyceae]MBD2035833.1 response regulator transcription factor [Leptolyngbya sp. FACHB-321]MBD2078189.1 response regulator transcription factor [Phormidium sp. FACHB-592]